MGSILAAATLYAIAGYSGHFDAFASAFASNGYGARSPDHYDVTSAFLIETVLTTLLVLTILGAADFADPVGFAGNRDRAVPDPYLSHLDPSNQYLGQSAP